MAGSLSVSESLVLLFELSKVGGDFSEDASRPPFFWVHFTEWLLVGLLVDHDLLAYRKKVENKIIEIETRGEPVEQQGHHDRHHPDHGFLPGILDGHFLLDEHRDAHKEGKATDIPDAEEGNLEGEADDRVGY